MIKVFITLVLCSCMKEKIWPTTNNGSVDNVPTTRLPCGHDSTPVTSSPIDNITLITSLQADNITLTSLPFDEIPSTSLPVSNITSTVSFPVVNIILTPTVSIYNITRLSPEVVDHTPFTTTELANDIPTVTELVGNVTSIPPSLIETVTSKTTEFINDTSLTITELSNHITSSPTEFLDNITSVILSSVGNTSSMSTELINNFTLTTTKLVNRINSAIESAFNISTTPSLVDDITSSIAGFDVNNTSSTTEVVNNTLLITILLPVNDITLTTSSPYNFTSSIKEIVDNVTSTTTVNTTTLTTESINNIISVTSSAFNFSSTTEEMIDNITSTISSKLSNGHSEILATLPPTYNPPSEPSPPKHALKKFKIYWNVPSFVCCRHGLNFEDISKFGIVQNVNDTFRGKDVAILYDPGLFPAFIKSSNGSITIRNGGVPHKGDLLKHLEAFKKDIDLQVDVNFSGVGIIDFEHWRPILRLNWAALHQYRKYSYEIEKIENPDLNEAEIKKLASEKFEKHARAFMEETIKMAKILRPKASWSYYGFPWCNNLTPQHKSTQCHPMLIENNDDIQWLWNQENVLLPTIYIPMNLSSDKRVGLINGRLNEAHRIARKTNSQPKILPYFWFKYRDHSDVFLSRDDLILAFEEMLTQNIDGFILWGSSNDVNTKAKCQKLHDYMNQVFGPLVKDILINQRVVSNNTLLTTILLPVNDITLTTSSPYNFTSSIKEIVDNVTSTTTVNTTTLTTESINNIISVTSSAFNFSSTTEEMIDNITSTISSKLSNGHSEILATLPLTYNPPSEPSPPKHALKKFKIYWNVPSFVCRRHGLNFEDISKFGIIQNVNDTFRGKDVAILYDPGLFPAFIKSSNGSITIRNGGVPQKGDLLKHLEAFKKDIDLQVDVNFSGVGIIDFEHWRPILRLNWAALHQYRKYSYEIEKIENPDLNEAEIKKLASEKFEKHARAFMEETIKMAKILRPKASWSYYGFPWCNNLTPQHKSTQCHPMLIENNDDIQWLWNQENVLLPTIYIPMNLSSDKRVGFINGRLNEAHRIARKTNSQPKILPYFWFKYRDHSDVFLSRDDLILAFEELVTQNIDGFILWGSSNDVNTKAKCQQLHDYMNQVFGPLVKDILINQPVVSNEVFEK